MNWLLIMNMILLLLILKFLFLLIKFKQKETHTRVNKLQIDLSFLSLKIINNFFLFCTSSLVANRQEFLFFFNLLG